MTGYMSPNRTLLVDPPQPEERLRRIVCVSDTHDRHGKFPMPTGDILLHAGDFTFQGKGDELIRFNDWLDQDEMEFSHKVVVPGNHDLTFETDWEWATAHVYAADAILNGELYEADGLKIWGEPRQPWFYDWAYNVPRDKMAEVWNKIPTDVDVLLTHGPPLGAGDLTIPRHGRPATHVGCQFQREWIEKHQPKLVVCGHIHSGYGIYTIGKTLVVNASVCNEKYNPVNAPIIVHI